MEEKAAVVRVDNSGRVACNIFINKAFNKAIIGKVGPSNRGQQLRDHLLKVVLGELVGDPQKLVTGMRVGEGPDAEAVGGVELTLEELAADVLDLGEL
jgi:hypothetical protein